MSIQKSLKDAMLTGAGLVSWGNNEPTQYEAKQHQYYSAETRTYTQIYAQYSSDFVEAQIQGIDPENPLTYQTRMIRFADVVKPSAAIQRHFDDYKMMLVADRDIEYIMPGSKIQTLGSTWLVVNPMNVSGSDGMALVRRCNAVWNFYDFYGNVVSEPLIVENERANANDPDTQNSQQITKGYFNVLCQYNDNTRQIDTNTRMILGTAAYRVTGYSDFETEFTGDYSSVRMLSFTVRYEEPNDSIDDMENHVAGGKIFAWNINITSPDAMRVGATVQASAASVRNGEIVPVSGDNPVTYRWASSDENVLTVDENGLVTAVSEGDAVLTATLEQNPAISAAFSVTVTDAEDGVAFTSTVPQTLGAYESVTVTAAYFADGAETEEALVWTFAQADDTAYSYHVAADGKSATIQCYGYSAQPLVVSVLYGAYKAQAEIRLEGF